MPVRTLAALVALNLLLTLALLWRDTRSTAQLAHPVAPEPAELVPAEVRPAPVHDEDALRRIVREELARALAPSSTIEEPASAAPAVAQGHDPLLDWERERLGDEIAGAIDDYIAAGVIAPADMARLQLSLAQLPEPRRSELLNRLTRALSDGEIEGAF
ncbi:MAG: hypothetical protein R3233_07305 [Xanthomonadales bacterium]|nr:hypothetical protein [Xanthomonadales bacterium]